MHIFIIFCRAARCFLSTWQNQRLWRSVEINVFQHSETWFLFFHLEHSERHTLVSYNEYFHYEEKCLDYHMLKKQLIWCFSLSLLSSAHARRLSRLGRCCGYKHGDEGSERNGERRHERTLFGGQRHPTDGRRPGLHRRLPGARFGREAGLYLPAPPEWVRSGGLCLTDLWSWLKLWCMWWWWTIPLMLKHLWCFLHLQPIKPSLESTGLWSFWIRWRWEMTSSPQQVEVFCPLSISTRVCCAPAVSEVCRDRPSHAAGWHQEERAGAGGDWLQSCGAGTPSLLGFRVPRRIHRLQSSTENIL